MSRGRRSAPSLATTPAVSDADLVGFAVRLGIVFDDRGRQLEAGDEELLFLDSKTFDLVLDLETYCAMIQDAAPRLPGRPQVEILGKGRGIHLSIRAHGQRSEANVSFLGHLDRRGILAAELRGLLQLYSRSAVSAIQSFAPAPLSRPGRHTTVAAAMNRR